MYLPTARKIMDRSINSTIEDILKIFFWRKLGTVTMTRPCHRRPVWRNSHSSPSLHHTAFGMVDKYNKVLPLVLEVLMLFDIIDFSFDYD